MVLAAAETVATAVHLLLTELMDLAVVEVDRRPVWAQLVVQELLLFVM